MKYKEYYRRDLPHWHPQGASFFITTRLAGTLPLPGIRRIIEQFKHQSPEVIIQQFDSSLKMKHTAVKYQEILTFKKKGPSWLADPKIAQIWNDALFHFDDKRYNVIASTIMPNHVHFIMKPLTHQVPEIMKSTKGYSSLKSNQVLDRAGVPFWFKEYFDHWIRNDEQLQVYINYILNNPVKAGLVSNWRDYRWNYVHPDYKHLVVL